MSKSDHSFKSYFSSYLGELHKDFEVEQGVTMEHRIWGSGTVLSVAIRDRGGWYLNVQFSNHQKQILSESILGHFVKSMSIKSEFANIYKQQVVDITREEEGRLSCELVDAGDSIPLLQDELSTVACINETPDVLASAFPSFSEQEIQQISSYIALYHQLEASELYEINEYIEKNKQWDDFDLIRSLNTHANGKQVKGIAPKFYKACCDVLHIGNGKGTALVSSNTW